MATPFVVGVSLLMRDANPSLTPQQIKDAMTSTAEDWGPSGADPDYGAGRLDAYAALRAIGAPLGSTGAAVPTHTFRSGSLSGTGASTDITLDVTDTQYPIAATMIESSVTAATSSTPNFNLALLNPSGAQVASATTSNRQDALTYQADDDGQLRPARELGERQRPLLRRHLRRDGRRGSAASAPAAAASSASAAASASAAGPDGAGRADAQLRHGGAGQRRARVERTVLERRLGDHGLQDLPRHLERR